MHSRRHPSAGTFEVPVRVVYSTKRTRTISIHVEPSEIIVHAPAGIHDDSLQKALDKRRAWIESTLTRVRARKSETVIWYEHGFTIHGTPATVQFVPSRTPRWSVKEQNHAILVTGPATTIDDDAVRDAFVGYLRKCAAEVIAARVDHYACRLGLTYERITIKDQKSRWGSCSAKGNLNFNWRLILAPPQVLDYVVVHELCHLVQMNHSSAFWALVGQAMPEFGQHRRWLRQQGQSLYIV